MKNLFFALFALVLLSSCGKEMDLVEPTPEYFFNVEAQEAKVVIQYESDRPGYEIFIGNSMEAVTEDPHSNKGVFVIRSSTRTGCGTNTISQVWSQTFVRVTSMDGSIDDVKSVEGL